MLKILGGKLPGKIGRCRHKVTEATLRSQLLKKVTDRNGMGPVQEDLLLYIYASLAQSVEHAAVNRRVVGSSPTGGAKKKSITERWSISF